MSSVNSNDSQNFLDRGTITALVVVAAMWFGWSYWVDSKYPKTETAAQQSKTESPATTSQQNLVTNDVNTIQEHLPVAASTQREVAIQIQGVNGLLSSNGMALKKLIVQSHTDREGNPIEIGRSDLGVGATALAGSAELINFELTQQGAKWVGAAQRNGYLIRKIISPLSDGTAGGENAWAIQTEVSGDLSQFPGLRVYLADQIQEPGTTSILSPSKDYFDWYAKTDENKNHQILDPKKPAGFNHNAVSAIALSSHYFTAAIADKSSLKPDFTAEPVSTSGTTYLAKGYIEYKPTTKGQTFAVEQIVYVGPKVVEQMSAVNENFSGVVDFGTFGKLASPLLWLMRLFHSLFNNWGLAIIAMTLVVRMIVAPFNYYSFKSMKVMQTIQPQIQALKERYKADPRKMNEEVMLLMKQNKANPLGGCLPMALQLPVFFALYQVLAQSIELYKAPFGLWIYDLSVRDPYFVLPILMGISMFVQQKVTPVADPQQAKIMQWMPVMFCFFMISLPSGLTLYMFVSTVFGILQQRLFMRESPGQKGSPALA